MTTAIQFRNRPIRKTPSRAFRPLPFNAVWLIIVAAAWGLLQLPSVPHFAPLPDEAKGAIAQRFALCSALRRDDCVIDGDTFAYRGQSIRIADIDAPETHPSRCDKEERLGTQATYRLQELLNAGPFTLARWDSRDTDRYGRKLRTVMRDGRSLGGMLVAEGLAREWTGRRLPWCS